MMKGKQQVKLDAKWAVRSIRIKTVEDESIIVLGIIFVKDLPAPYI